MNKHKRDSHSSRRQHLSHKQHTDIPVFDGSDSEGVRDTTHTGQGYRRAHEERNSLVTQGDIPNFEGSDSEGVRDTTHTG